MSYTINLTNGSLLTTVADGTIGNASTLTLIGRDYAGYGTFLNENFVYMLENFANGTGPANPLKGQLWWDTTNNVLRVWSGTTWKISTGATSQSTAPADLSGLGGDLWFDTANQQLKVYSGTQWIVVGPTATTATGNTGVVPAIIADNSSGSHIILEFYVNNTIYAIFSKDTFTTSAVAGFSSIVPGINFISTGGFGLNTQATTATPSTLVQRDGSGSIAVNAITAAGAITAGSIVAGSISTPSGGLTGNLSGNVTGTYGTFTTIQTQGINASSGYTGTVLTASQPNITTVGNLTALNVAGNLTVGGVANFNGTAYLNGQPILTSNGSFTASSINNTPIGNATPSTGAFTSVLISTSLAPITAANTTVNLGSPTAWWGNIYGTAIHAQYADLAERFWADAEYPAGTVVEMGGANEITKVVAELSDRVFGVISTNAAYLMNSGAGEDATHPPIAMSGRVPVLAVGLIAKGDRLVSAGNGVARAGSATEITPWNVIGRSLVDKTTEGQELIEAIVKINS